MERIALVVIGIAASTLFWVYVTSPQVETVEEFGVIAPIVSVMEEKKRCEEWGGYFYLGNEYLYSTEQSYHVSCVKSFSEPLKETTEYLFKYEF